MKSHWKRHQSILHTVADLDQSASIRLAPRHLPPLHRDQSLHAVSRNRQARCLTSESRTLQERIASLLHWTSHTTTSFGRQYLDRTHRCQYHQFLKSSGLHRQPFDRANSHRSPQSRDLLRHDVPPSKAPWATNRRSRPSKRTPTTSWSRTKNTHTRAPSSGHVPSRRSGASPAPTRPAELIERA